LLYDLYVNDLQYAVDCIPRLYDDDTCLVIQGKTAEQLQYSLNSEMTKVEQWMSANQLTINPQKSAILPIYPSVKTPPIKLEVNINQFLVLLPTHSNI